ncbi:hypothetical protein GALMADRAFT_254240 [Galerina marginata CBS 339.88]|uniref:Polynucleotide 5'-hydroxyl-kinase GRC3 n=1 Tax=Galerina marginata (strain CBS 339.88) TaxID=685588 RepID=A0A067SM18_GALM3|nr:hypothetical protein GALMADRAFT_254240 [Galerina marginata CBS 339.88]
MLSAVAARKAALASQKDSEPITTPSASSSKAQVPPPPPRKDPPKRKPSSQKFRPETKKPRKLKPFEKSNGPRSAPVDVFKDQEDMIIVDPDSDGESDSAMSILDDSDKGPISSPGRTSQKQRAWSSSQAVEDSSDEDSMQEEGAVPLDVSSLLPHLANNLRGQEKNSEDGTLLSTFEPRLDHNLFVLTDDECRSLGLSSKATLVALTADDVLCFLGTCTLTVLHGSINIFGTTLSSSSSAYPIYAPRSAPLPVLRTGSGQDSTLGIENLSSRLRNILQFQAVVLLQELRTNVEGLGRICRTFEGVFEPSRWQKSSTQTPFDIPGLYLIHRQTKECRPYSIPSSWTSTLDRILSKSDSMSCGTYIVKGPKNAGKSTLARTLTNRLLESYQRVAFLECDIGQSEFTPGGMVSLNVISKPILGPPFTHPTLPNHAHFVGSNTPRSSPAHYLDAILALIQTYRLDIQSPAIETDDSDLRISDMIPLVVNTMGWSKGLGADLTERIESMLEPTDIFDIQAPVREDYPGSGLPPSMGHQHHGYGAYQERSMMDGSNSRSHVLDPISSSSAAAGYTPADHRTLSILSYFYARFPFDAVPGDLEQITAKSWDISRPLCAVPPYQVDCSVAFDKVILSGAGSEDVVEEEIGRVLNGAIVGIVSYEPGTIDIESIPEEGSSLAMTGIPYTQHHGPPPPVSSNCVGIALIRGVSPPSKEAVSADGAKARVKTYFHILTPLPQALLARSRVLVKGEMELPVWGMLDFRNFEGKDADIGDVAGVNRENVPFLQWGKGAEGALGADKKRVRRNLMRRGQM